MLFKTMNWKIFFSFLFFYSFFLLSNLFSSNYEWKQTKLTSGFVQKIVFDPQNENNVYAAASNGFYWSSDGGETWKWKVLSYQPGGGIETISIKGIAIDPVFNRIMYLATNKGLFQSHDATIFKKINVTGSGLDTNYFDEVLTVPINTGAELEDGTLRGSDIFLTSGNTLFRSINTGKNWVKIGADSFLGSAIRLVNDQNDIKKIYCISHSSLSYSDDIGTTWKLIQFPNIFSYKSLTIHPKDPKTIFVVAIQQDSANPYSQLLVSTNALISWNTVPITVSNSSLEYNFLTIDQSDKVYLGTNQGILMSNIDLKDWAWMNQGFEKENIPNVLSITPSPSGTFLLAGTAGKGIFKTYLIEKKP